MTLRTLENPPLACREAQDPSGAFVTFLSRFVCISIRVMLKPGAWETPRRDEHKPRGTHSHGFHKNREKELRFPWLGLEGLRQAGNTGGINSEQVCILKRAGNQQNQTLDAKFFSEDGVAPLSTLCAS